MSERVGYMGNLHQLSPAYRQDAFRRALEELGVDLLLGGNRDDWRDYSSVDVVLAARDAHPDLLLTKPASKLVNAWLAGCPALLGPEPAFQDLRRSEPRADGSTQESPAFPRGRPSTGPRAGGRRHSPPVGSFGRKGPRSSLGRPPGGPASGGRGRDVPGAGNY